MNPRPGTGKHRPAVFVPICICLWAMSVAATGCSTRAVQVGQHAYTFEHDDLQINYLLFLPEDYGRNRSKRWPLILFLHGSGERSSTVEELERLKEVIRPKLEAAISVLRDLCDDLEID